MNFRPLHDRVVVKRIEAEEKTAGGIIVPDTAKEKPQQGEVITVGPGGRDETGKLAPIDVQVGDRILFGKWSGTPDGSPAATPLRPALAHETVRFVRRGRRRAGRRDARAG